MSPVCDILSAQVFRSKLYRAKVFYIKLTKLKPNSVFLQNSSSRRQVPLLNLFNLLLLFSLFYSADLPCVCSFFLRRFFFRIADVPSIGIAEHYSDLFSVTSACRFKCKINALG